MTTVHAPTGAALSTTWKNAPTTTLNAGGVEFAYRQLGPSTGVPVVFLTHLAAVLDNWDPRVVDGIAAKHRVITFDYRGVGASSGSTPTTIEEMARDAVTFIRALGFDQVDLFGLSMGGMIAQVIAQHARHLHRRAARIRDERRLHRTRTSHPHRAHQRKGTPGRSRSWCAS